MKTQEMIRKDRRLRRVDDFARDHLAEAIRLEDAAHVAALSRTYFSTYFRKKTGIGFHQWLQCLRLAKAEQLILTTEKSLTEIAFRVGFQDPRTFQRAFKRNKGKVPSLLRRERAPSSSKLPSRAEQMPRRTDGRSRRMRGKIGT